MSGKGVPRATGSMPGNAGESGRSDRKEASRLPAPGCPPTRDGTPIAMHLQAKRIELEGQERKLNEQLHGIDERKKIRLKSLENLKSLPSIDTDAARTDIIAEASAEISTALKRRTGVTDQLKKVRQAEQYSKEHWKICSKLGLCQPRQENGASPPALSSGDPLMTLKENVNKRIKAADCAIKRKQDLEKLCRDLRLDVVSPQKLEAKRRELKKQEIDTAKQLKLVDKAERDHKQCQRDRTTLADDLSSMKAKLEDHLADAQRAIKLRDSFNAICQELGLRKTTSRVLGNASESGRSDRKEASRLPAPGCPPTRDGTPIAMHLQAKRIELEGQERKLNEQLHGIDERKKIRLKSLENLKSLPSIDTDAARTDIIAEASAEISTALKRRTGVTDQLKKVRQAEQYSKEHWKICSKLGLCQPRQENGASPPALSSGDPLMTLKENVNKRIKAADCAIKRKQDLEKLCRDLRLDVVSPQKLEAKRRELKKQEIDTAKQLKLVDKAERDHKQCQRDRTTLADDLSSMKAKLEDHLADAQRAIKLRDSFNAICQELGLRRAVGVSQRSPGQSTAQKEEKQRKRKTPPSSTGSAKKRAKTSHVDQSQAAMDADLLDSSDSIIIDSDMTKRMNEALRSSRVSSVVQPATTKRANSSPMDQSSVSQSSVDQSPVDQPPVQPQRPESTQRAQAFKYDPVENGGKLLVFFDEKKTLEALPFLVQSGAVFYTVNVQQSDGSIVASVHVHGLDIVKDESRYDAQAAIEVQHACPEHFFHVTDRRNAQITYQILSGCAMREGRIGLWRNKPILFAVKGDDAIISYAEVSPNEKSGESWEFKHHTCKLDEIETFKLTLTDWWNLVHRLSSSRPADLPERKRTRQTQTILRI